MESISRFVDNVFDLVTNDSVALLSLTENAPTFVFVGLVTFGGPIALTKNGLPLVFIGLASSGGPATPIENSPTLVMVNLTSFTGLASSTWSYWFNSCFNFFKYFLLVQLSF